MSIHLVNNLNCFKQKSRFIGGIFCLETCVFVILVYPVIGYVLDDSVNPVVSNTSKVLKRKQITTGAYIHYYICSCFQYIKGTKKKANHNERAKSFSAVWVVSNTSKVLKRKQITT